MEPTPPALGRVIVVGAGLIGTSIGLALAATGTRVLLTDRDPETVRVAAGLGAGTPLAGTDGPADLAVLAVPPDAVAETLLAAQERGLARSYTDVASVKELPLAEAAKLGCALEPFVGGHPMGGRERSGPLAATAELFRGRPWVLCPTEETGPEAVAAATALALACGAAPRVLTAEDHDRAVALVSHVPHVMASAMAARFADASAAFLGLAGQGGRDVTRIAAADPALWRAILTANAHAVADVVDRIVGDLAAASAELRADPSARTPGGPLDRLLLDGASGRARLT